MSESVTLTKSYKGLRIAFCLPGRSYSGNFLMAWTNLFGNCLRAGISVKLSQMPYGSGTVARVWALKADRAKGKYQAPFDNEPYDYIMWVDSDQIFSFEKLKLLINADEPIVSGYYPLANGAAYSIGRLNNDTRLLQALGEEELAKEPRDAKGLVEVDWCGFGWTLLKKGVIEKIAYPWFACPEIEIGGIVDLIGEDIYFCRKANAAGFKILIHPDCRVGHEKIIII